MTRIYINLERRTPPAHFRLFGSRLVPTFNYFQTAVCLYQDGHLTLPAVAHVADNLINALGLYTGAPGELARRHRAARASDAGQRDRDA